MLIALHRGTGFIAKCIQWQTRSPYSHASVLISESNGWGVEAREFKGVREFDGANWHPGGQVDYFRVQITARQWKLVRDFLLDQVGKPYDYTMVARFITRRQEKRETSGKWFCSELVYYAFMQAGINLLDRIEPWAVSPGLLAYSPLLIPVNAHGESNLREAAQAMGNNTPMLEDASPVSPPPSFNPETNSQANN